MSVPNIPQAISVEQLSQLPKNIESKNPSLCQKSKYLFTHISVEPIMFFFVLAFLMNLLANQNLALEKACRVNLKFNASICDALVLRDKSRYEPFHETEVQKLVTKFTAYSTILMGSIPACLMIFLGSWSDRHGRRKPIIMIPVVGACLASVGLFMCSYFFLELSIEYSWFCETVATSCFGGWGCLSLGLYSYLGQQTDEKERTWRIGLLSITATVGLTIGIFFSGISLNQLGFKGVYCITATLYLIVLLYTFFAIKEEPKEMKENKDGFLKDFFALKHIKNTVAVCFKKGEDHRRKKMIVLILAGMMVIGPMHGEFALTYMYIRLKCGWNEVDYSIYNFIHALIQLAGTSFSLTLFSKILQLQDAVLGILAMFSKIAACIIYAFAPSGKYFYIGAVVEVFNGTCHVALRSILAKVVPPDELGQSNSIFGICESLMPLAFGPLYTFIYIQTLTFFPGTFYLVTSGLYVITLSLYIYLFKLGRDDQKIKLMSDEKEKQLLVEKMLFLEKMKEVSTEVSPNI